MLPTIVGQLCRARRSEESQAWRQPIDLVPVLQSAFQELPKLAEQGRGKKWQPPADPIHAVYQAARRPATKTRVFIDYLADAFAKQRHFAA